VEWRRASSAAPSVITPTLQCGIGMRAIRAAATAAKASMRLPSTQQQIGLPFAKGVGKADHRQPHRLGDTHRGFEAEQHIQIPVRRVSYPDIAFRPAEQAGINSVTSYYLLLSPVFSDCFDNPNKSRVISDDNIRALAIA